MSYYIITLDGIISAELTRLLHTTGAWFNGSSLHALAQTDTPDPTHPRPDQPCKPGEVCPDSSKPGHEPLIVAIVIVSLIIGFLIGYFVGKKSSAVGATL